MSDDSKSTQIHLRTRDDAEAEMHRMSRRSFMWAGTAVLGVVCGREWLNSRVQADGVVWPLRRALRFDERVGRAVFDPARLAPQFDRSLATVPRPNGDIGLDDDFDPDTWKLRLVGLADMSGAVAAAASAAPVRAPRRAGDGGKKGSTIGLPAGLTRPPAPAPESAVELSIEAIHTLPRVEMVTELKCIEGWSNVVRWAGARLSDLIARYPPITHSGARPDVRGNPGDLAQYVSLTTPDEGYYVGLDMPSALHAQTLLCYEMNGAPLTLDHGAPLRLVIPVKYGIKHIKRIGTIRFTNARPADYWAEEGYDWYAGH